MAELSEINENLSPQLGLGAVLGNVDLTMIVTFG